MQKVDRLVLTLRRGLAGKKEAYKNAITKALGLTRTHQSVEVPNNFEFRATARKARLCPPSLAQLDPLRRCVAALRVRARAPPLQPR